MTIASGWNVDMSAARRLPELSSMTLDELRDAQANCTRCELYGPQTEVVSGVVSGRRPVVSARLMLMGEQPGDQEDLEGQPSVGPAARVFYQALQEAGIDRQGVFVSNAVKHFRFAAPGKGRLHLLVTIHPSYPLRIREADDGAEEYGRFLEDSKMAQEKMAQEASTRTE
jgi:uracil-DNA glycosylase